MTEQYSREQFDSSKAEFDQARAKLNPGSLLNTTNNLVGQIQESARVMEEQIQLARDEARNINNQYSKILDGSSEMTDEEIDTFRVNQLGESPEKIIQEKYVAAKLRERKIREQLGALRQTRIDLGRKIARIRSDEDEEQVIETIKQLSPEILELKALNSGASLLDTAVFYNKPKIVQTLLDRGLDPNKSLNPSHSSLEMFEILLKYGANPKGEKGKTPPIFRCSSPEKANLLIRYGADVGERYQKTDPKRPEYYNIENHPGDSALHYIARLETPHVKMITYFLAQGLDINGLNDYGQTPLDCLAWEWNKRGKEKKRILREHGAKTSEELKQSQDLPASAE